MHHDTAPRRILSRLFRVPTVLAGLAIAGLLVAAGATLAAWQATATAPLGSASITTGTLTIDSVDVGSWRSGGAPFDPVTTALKADQTLTYTTIVNVTAIGDSLQATLMYSGGASIPPGIWSNVTVAMESVSLSGADSDTDGNQTVPITLTVTADDGLLPSPDQLNLTNLQLQITNGASWTDTATLNVGTIAVYNGVDLADAGYVATYDLAEDVDQDGDDCTVAIYLTNPNATISWGDGQTTEAVAADDVARKYEHPYTETGTVQVAIEGTFGGIGSPEQTEADVAALISVDKWSGSTGTTSAAYAYKNAVNAFSGETTRFPAPPTTVTDMTGTFQNATSMYAVSWGWDTSNVTTMSSMFDGAKAFVSMESVAAWNTAQVTDMSSMFKGAALFNGNLSSWNMGNVTNTSHMFDGATQFSGYFPVGGWDVSKVTDMSFMFAGAAEFNSPIGSWKTGNVTTMQSMFNGAAWMAQDLSCWDVSKVTSYSNFSDGNTQSAFVAPTWGSTPATVCIIDPGSGPLRLRVDPSKGQVTRLHLTGANAVINWGDGTPTDTAVPGTTIYTHTYASMTSSPWPPIEITISGTLGGFGSVDQTTEDVQNLVEVLDWGGTYVKSGAYAFRNTINLTGVAQIPQTMTTVEGMFQDSTSFLTSYIGGWDTSHVTNMSRMFQGATDFNQSLSSWDTSHVTDMSFMFDGATEFNGYVWVFDTSRVTTMEAMFRGTVFNQDVSAHTDWPDKSRWDTSNVLNMSSMFAGVASFNRDLSTWDVQNVEDMSLMFAGATSFNQDLNTWAVYNVTTMASMFQGAAAFTADNGNLGYWYPEKVQDMSHMFDGASLAKEGGGIGFWNVGSVTDFSYMFANSQFNGYNIAKWPVRTDKDVNMSHMFYKATEYNQPLVDVSVYGVAELQTLNVGNVVDMSSMFEGATSFNQPLASWNTANVTTMNRMFANATAMDQDLRCWDVSKVTDHADFMLGNGQTGFLEPFWPGTDNSAAVPGCPVPVSGDPMVLTYSSGTATLNLTDPDALVYWADGSRTIADSSGTYASETTIAGEVKVYGSFAGLGSPAQTPAQMGNLTALESWGTTGIKSAANAFRSATSLTSVPATLPSTITSLSGAFAGATSFAGFTASPNWDVSRVQDMSFMFNGASVFTGTFLNLWNTGSVTNMSHMFDGAGLVSDVGGVAYWNVSNVADFSSMFANTANYLGNGLARWQINTSGPVNMSRMFFNAGAFVNDLSEATYAGDSNSYTWDVSAVTDMSYMFAGATAFNGDVTAWKTDDVTVMNHMFENATSFNRDIGEWDVSMVTNMAYMFGGAATFNQDLSKWTTSSVQNMEGMFYAAKAMDQSQDLSGWNVSSVLQPATGWPESQLAYFATNANLTGCQVPDFWNGVSGAPGRVCQVAAVQESSAATLAPVEGSARGATALSGLPGAAETSSDVPEPSPAPTRSPTSTPTPAEVVEPTAVPSETAVPTTPQTPDARTEEDDG